MDFNRVKHSHSVAVKMQEIGRKMGLSENELNQLFILGLNHDIGYQFTSNKNEHNKVGGEFLKQANYKYWKEVYYHGEIDIEYKSLYLDILNLADMQIDKNGEDVGLKRRLIDIQERYGKESDIYNKCYILINNLKNKYEEI